MPVELDVLRYEDPVIAVNKPARLAVHSARGHEDDNLVLRLNAWLDQEGIDHDPPLAPANRLDVQASGVVLFGLRHDTRVSLSKQFEERKVKKVYWAIVSGRARKKGVINRPLKSPGGGPAKAARTRYRTTLVTQRASLLRVTIETGRPHQIRRHLSSIGLPILGDTRYGVRGAAMAWRERYEADRIMLHCRSIELTHPATGEPFRALGSPDETWTRVMDALFPVIEDDEDAHEAEVEIDVDTEVQAETEREGLAEPSEAEGSEQAESGETP